MKIGIKSKLFYIIILLSILSYSLFADTCDWSKIQKNADGTYTYSKTLHVCVGQTVQDNKIKDEQVSKLTEAISLKDLAIQKADQRTQLWMDTSEKLENRMQKVDELVKGNERLYFILGVVTTGAAVFLAAKAIK